MVYVCVAVYVKNHEKKNERDGRVAGQACRKMPGRSCLDFDFVQRWEKRRNGSCGGWWVESKTSHEWHHRQFLPDIAHGFVLLAV